MKDIRLRQQHGKEALKLLSSDIDIMILDIMMPEVSGYDIVKNERYAT